MLTLNRWCLAVALSGVLLSGVLFSQFEQFTTRAAEVTDVGPDTGRTEAEAMRHFDAKIAPLLAERCLECHDSTVQEGRLDLSRKQTALAGGRNGPAIVPGNPEESLAWDYVDLGDMPPEDREPLSEEERALLRAWIADGAVWSGDRIDATAIRRDSRALEQWVQRLTVREYVETVRSALGVDIEEEAYRLLPSDRRADGFTNTAYNLGIDLAHVEAYAELARIMVERLDVETFVGRFVDCDDLDEGCVRELVAEMGHWLFRGPLEEFEIEAFVAVADAVAEEDGDFIEAASYIVEAMVQSPRFIYRIERQRGDGEPRVVSAYELASRMSYIIWGGPPDEELLKAADNGELSDTSQIHEQINRMLQDPRAVERSEQFIYEWMGLERLASLAPNEAHFPEWDSQLAVAMREETLAVFSHLIWQQNRPVWDVLDAQVTYATPRLARFYELQDVPARPVDIAPARHPGRVTDNLQALYTFSEGSGDRVHDRSGRQDPLDLVIADPSAVSWGDEGLTIEGETLIATQDPPYRLSQAMRGSQGRSGSGAITIEAWVTPANTSQDGPARIVTLSNDTSNRNFTLGQDGDRYDARLRTTSTTDNGMPSLNTDGDTVRTELTHVVYTRHADGGTTFYLDGQEVAGAEVSGDFSNWNEVFRLALAAELSDERYWQGTYHLVAIYDDALSAQDVQQNQTAGPRDHHEADPGVQLAYRFDGGEGNIIRDEAGVGEPIDLKIDDASAVEWTDAGLRIHGPTRIISAEPPHRLIQAAKRSRALTIEAWLTPANTSQDGPARIVSLSSDSTNRNFTLGQDGDRYDARLRTTSTDDNGLPSVRTESGSAENRAMHLVYTRGAGGRATLYIDGEPQGTDDVSGDFSNWVDDFHLILGNERSGDRPWQGTLHAVNIYSRALTADEIAHRGKRMWRYDLASVPSRGGLLTHAGVLTVGGDEASMVSRGLFVLNDILDSAVGSAPPGVDTTPVPAEPGLSQRGLAESRLSNSSCVGCHVRFEPLAFGLEKFNGIGRFAEVDEHGNDLREDGEILFPGSDEPTSYETIGELMSILAANDHVQLTVTRKLTQFAIGRPLVGADAATVEQVHHAAREDGGTYESLITAIITSDLIQKTRTERDR
ncbi:MAG: LamG-like jellyroll fold domain-containing protein [Phycisphaeraceae bacterium]